MSWHDYAATPARFRGEVFKLDANTRFGGRRGFTYEFAKSDRSLDEDLGKRVTRVAVAAYVIGPNYNREADDLENALNREGGGTLILPMLGSLFVRCETYARTESREEGGIARFQISFVDASGSTAMLFSENTQGAAQGAATTLADDTAFSAGNSADWQ